MFLNAFGYIGLGAILGWLMHSQIDTNGNSTYLRSKVNNYIFCLKELENVNMYDSVAEFDVKFISKKG